MSYTTRAKVSNYLMTDIDASFDGQLTLWISAVERHINNYTGRKDGFDADSDASVRYYDGNGKREILVDNFTEISNLQILETSGDDVQDTLTEGRDNDYITYPYSDSPKYKIILVTSAGIGSFYKGDGRIKVTAKWGYANEVPADIELVATILVAEIVKMGRDGGLVSSESLGDYDTAFTNAMRRMTDVKKILNQYKILKL